MAWCDCAERPMCQSRWCESPASWTAFKPKWPSSFAPATFQFMCVEHYEIYRDGMTTKIKGVDRPDNAPDDWKGSISECVRHAEIAIAFAERNNRP